ncbi:helix-turn-helix domain-containing protein [Leucobacter albus]|uniref:Helix-turn-helix domain-containing protein n=1 Tax=Leucobacter albus TaxID=272210 RepID=A0ABW3TJX0_9MICO
MATLTELLDAAGPHPASQRAEFLAARDLQFRKQLVSWRIARGISQQELGERMGISQQAVNKFERYDSDPKLSSVRRYANALGLLIQYEIIDDNHQGAQAPEDNSVARGTESEPVATHRV